MSENPPFTKSAELDAAEKKDSLAAALSSPVPAPATAKFSRIFDLLSQRDPTLNSTLYEEAEFASLVTSSYAALAPQDAKESGPQEMSEQEKAVHEAFDAARKRVAPLVKEALDAERWGTTRLNPIERTAEIHERHKSAVAVPAPEDTDDFEKLVLAYAEAVLEANERGGDGSSEDAENSLYFYVSRLRSQVERMEADLPTREEAWEMIEDLAPRHEMGCSHWKIPDREDTPEIDTDCDCTRKPFYEKLRRLSSDSETGGTNG